MIAIFLLLLTRPGKGISDTFLLVVQMSNSAIEQEVFEKLKPHVDKLLIKSKTVSDLGSEFTLELRTNSEDTSFINKMQETKGVIRATLVAYDQDLNSV